MAKKFRSLEKKKEKILVSFSPSLIQELKSIFTEKNINFDEIRFSSLLAEMIENFIDDCEDGRIDVEKEFNYLKGKEENKLDDL